MLRVVLGLLKGGLIGAAVGYGAFRLGISGGVLGYAMCGVVGALVGVLGGRPPWRQETFWTSILKSVFGLLVALGLCWVGHKFLGDFHLAFATGLGAPDKPLVDVPFLLGPAIGALYGIFVEVDDNTGSAPARGGPPARR